MSYIDFNHVTKNYGDNKGLFDVDFHVKKGECFGIVGINGAGKTTILKHLMGISCPHSGSVQINGYDAFKEAKRIKSLVSYIPREVNFPSLETGEEFLRQQAEFFYVPDISKLSVADILKQSKKEENALDLLPESEILIFDEPITGLDYNQRSDFINIIKKEKEKGKTIIISSDVFDELEECCDRVAMINDGKLLRIVDIKSEIQNKEIKKYKIQFSDNQNFNDFKNENMSLCSTREKFNQAIVEVRNENTNEFFNMLSKYDVRLIKEIKPTLEDLFLNTYQESEDLDNQKSYDEESFGTVLNL